MSDARTTIAYVEDIDGQQETLTAAAVFFWCHLIVHVLGSFWRLHSNIIDLIS